MKKIPNNEYIKCDKCGFKIKKPTIKIDVINNEDTKFYFSPINDDDNYQINDDCVEINSDFLKEYIQNFNYLYSDIIVFKCPNCNEINTIDMYTSINPFTIK